MGHGLTVILLCAVLGAEPAPKVAARAYVLPDSSLGLRVQPLLLLSRPDVRADLGLDAKQAAHASTAIDELCARARALHGKPDAEARELRLEIDRAAERWLKDNLTRLQLRRLMEVDLQWEGPSALISRKIISEHLRLTAEQQKQLKIAIERRNQKRGAAGFEPEAENELAKKTLEVLSQPQREIWSVMLGPYFEPKPTTQTGVRAN